MTRTKIKKKTLKKPKLDRKKAMEDMAKEMGPIWEIEEGSRLDEGTIKKALPQSRGKKKDIYMTLTNQTFEKITELTNLTGGKGTRLITPKIKEIDDKRSSYKEITPDTIIGILHFNKQLDNTIKLLKKTRVKSGKLKKLKVKRPKT